MIVLDSTEDGFTEEEVSDEATSKNSDHARQPVGQGMFPGEGKSACKSAESRLDNFGQKWKLMTNICKCAFPCICEFCNP